MKFTILLIMSLITNFVIAHDHYHHTHTDEVYSGKQFVETQDLKVRMDKIMVLVKDVGQKKDDVKEVKLTGNKILDTANDIIKTCNLEPEADAAFHPTLALIMQAGEDFKIGKYEDGHKKMHKALLDYKKMFKREEEKS